MSNSAYKRIIKAMDKNPQWLVRRARRYENSRIHLRGHKLYRWISRYEHRPLHMLGECYGNRCPNSRLVHPERRAHFVHNVIQLVQTRWGNSLKELHYVAFGSGSLLQEVILLSRLFDMISVAHMNVVFYDQEYKVKDKQDESHILTMRCKQVELWMAHVAPQTSWSWSAVHAWEDVIFSAEKPTLLCAVDVEITSTLWKEIYANVQASKRCDSLLAIILDNHGITHVVQY
jgi:hypothetical protein